MKLQIGIPVSLIILTCATPIRAQELILNGNFALPSEENAVLPILPGAGIFTAVGAGTNTGIPDYTVTQGSVSVIYPGIGNTLGLLAAPGGDTQYALLNGFSTSLGVTGLPGTLSQNFDTTAGNIYQVSFVYGGVGVSAVGNTTGLQVGLTNATNSTAPNGGAVIAINLTGFQTETFDFTATANNSTLSFNEAGGSLATLDGIGLDNISVTPVPEPAAYGVAAAAFLFLLIGARAIRRQNAVENEIENVPAS